MKVTPQRIAGTLLVGINSVRGAAAEAIGTLLFAMRDSFARLRPAIKSICHDPSLAVNLSQ